MNNVVSFLGLLCVDEKNSSIKRMLTVCSEFERIARVVLERADKDSHSRRKRKQQETNDAAAETIPAGQPRQSTSPQATYNDGETPKPSQPGNIPNVFSPPDYARYLPDNKYQNLSNLTSNLSSALQDLGQGTPAMANWLSPRAMAASLPTSASSSATAPTFDFSSAGASAPASNRTSIHSAMANGNGVPITLPQTVDPLEMGNSFAHPFIPQDLWQMSMTLEWDWADMTAGSGLFGASPSVNGGLEDGLGMNRVLNGSDPGTGPEG